MNRLLALLVVVAGIVCLGMGIFFVAFGMSKGNWMADAMRQEKITLGLTAEQVAAGDVVDTMAELQKAGDTIRGHRHAIAPTYNDALKGGKFDPTNVAEATYAQGMNLENYLSVGVLSFGVVQLAEGVGAVMVVIALALIAIGIVLWRVSRKLNPVSQS
jgi:hypothetical protein